jgi:hypothetical protein
MDAFKLAFWLFFKAVRAILRQKEKDARGIPVRKKNCF